MPIEADTIIFPREQLSFVEKNVISGGWPGDVVAVRPLGGKLSKRRRRGSGSRPEYDNEEWLEKEAERLEAENRRLEMGE
jgi:hypothetical protein